MAEPLQKKALFNKLHIALLFFVILIAKSSQAQTLLLPGDIAFVSVSASSSTFEFIPLTNIEKGTEFQISNGFWSNENLSFTNSETVIFTAEANINAGTPIKFARSGVENFDVKGTVNLSTESERLFLYQKDSDVNRFIYAIGWGSNEGEKDSFFGSELPTIFKENPNSTLRLGSYNNYQYYIKNGASGTPKMLQDFVQKVAFWRGNDEQGFPKFGTSFNLLNPPVILFDQSLTTVKESDKSTILNVAIYEHDGSKLTVDVAFDSAYSSIDREEIKGFSAQTINFTGLIGDAVYEVEVPLENDRNYEGTETGIFTLQNLSKGRFGDFISHTVLVLDEEVPEIKLEISELLGESILVIHNLESREIDLGGWELSKGNIDIDLSRNTFLGVGESIVFIEEDMAIPASLLSSAYRLEKEQAKILSSQGTIQLRNEAGVKVSEVEKPRYDESKVSALNQSTKAPQSNRISQSTSAEIMTTSSSKIVFPGWKAINSSEVDVNDFGNTDLYFWDESKAEFLVAGKDVSTTPKEAILVGYFNESNASKLETKRKKSVAENEGGILRALISTTDSDENDRIQNLEGLNLVRNNTNVAVTAGTLEKLLKNKLEVDLSLYHSSPDFSNISLLKDDDLILPEKVFWVKVNSEVETVEIEIDLREGVETDFQEVDLEKGVLELEVVGQSNQASNIQINFLSETKEVQNNLNLKLNNKVFLNSFKGAVLAGAIADEYYDLVEVNSSLNNITELPLKFASDNSGEFELEVKRWTDIPDGWVIQVEDLKEDKVYELNENWSLKFNYTNLNDIESDEIITPFMEERFVVKVVPESLLDNESNDELPSSVELYQNYPNPFNPTTTLSFYMPEDGNVKLSVFNIVGQPVAVLIQETMSKGEHNLEWDASDMPSGIYIYQLEIGANIMTRKMTLVK
ncbi:MAG: T9SS type A sorting domain-containing protein [Balneola sp.]